MSRVIHWFIEMFGGERSRLARIEVAYRIREGER